MRPLARMSILPALTGSVRVVDLTDWSSGATAKNVAPFRPRLPDTQLPSTVRVTATNALSSTSTATTRNPVATSVCRSRPMPWSGYRSHHSRSSFGIRRTAARNPASPRALLRDAYCPVRWARRCSPVPRSGVPQSRRGRSFATSCAIAFNMCHDFGQPDQSAAVEGGVTRNFAAFYRPLQLPNMGGGVGWQPLIGKNVSTSGSSRSNPSYCLRHWGRARVTSSIHGTFQTRGEAPGTKWSPSWQFERRQSSLAASNGGSLSDLQGAIFVLPYSPASTVRLHQRTVTAVADGLGGDFRNHA